LGDVIFQILDSFSIPAVAPEFYGTQVANILAPDAPQRFNSKEWAEFSGVCGMQHVPRSNSWAPGNLDVQSILESKVPAVSSLPPYETTLKKNSRNSLVAVWQRAIGVKETGRFDAETIAGTKKLQESLMIEVTGFADETTWNAAVAISAKRDLLGPYPSRSIQLGSHGPHVARWQTFLGIATDGMFGLKTQEATKDFQKSIPVQPTGSVDAKTWAKARFKLLQA
jgi:peptidoglycan hydrolase-like protein with peptidoglycan-binding domain